MSLSRHAPLLALLCMMIVLSRAGYAHAQLPATTIESLAVDLWPDYDRPEVLVLLTGALPASTLLPATVTIPLPPGATLHAVARITSDNVMTDDVAYTQGENSVTFTTPDSRFRVEYYVPYTSNGSQRAFTFSWLADITLTEIDVAVQQPAAATNLQTQPAAASVSASSRDGLAYHLLPATAVPANTLYTAEVTYTMSQPTLTVEQAAPAPTAVTPPTADDAFNWALLLAVVGGVFVLIAIVWQVTSNRQKSKRPRKAPPQRAAVLPPVSPPVSSTPKPAPPKAARFCHDCGAPVKPEDKFCGNCGTAVKNRTEIGD